jgi:hypothetical protein
MMTQVQNGVVNKLYKSVIDDVISRTREIFLDEGIDEQVLVELRALWETKLAQTKAVIDETNEPDTGKPESKSSKSHSKDTKGATAPPPSKAANSGDTKPEVNSSMFSGPLVAVQINIPLNANIPSGPVKTITIQVSP